MARPKTYGPYVPSSIIRKYIAMWMAAHPDSNQVHVAWTTGFPERSIYRIISGESDTVRFDTADAILVRLGYFDAWLRDEELAEYYALA